MPLDPQLARQKLQQLQDTQASIESLTQWCIFHRREASAFVEVWLSQFLDFSLTSSRAITLFHSCNDILQRARAKNVLNYCEAWILPLPGTPDQPGALDQTLERLGDFVRCQSDYGWQKNEWEVVKKKVGRVLGVWRQRGVYDEQTCSRLEAVLSDNQQSRSTASPSSSSTAVSSDDLIRVLEEVEKTPGDVELNRRLVKLLEERLVQAKKAVDASPPAPKRQRTETPPVAVQSIAAVMAEDEDDEDEYVPVDPRSIARK